MSVLGNNKQAHFLGAHVDAALRPPSLIPSSQLCCEGGATTPTL